jgi:hypothetical protein
MNEKVVTNVADYFELVRGVLPPFIYAAAAEAPLSLRLFNH